jgi:hypothetical protein
LAAIGQAAPWPILRATNESGRQSIALDVSTGLNEDVRGIDAFGLESALVDRAVADRLVSDAESHGVGS